MFFIIALRGVVCTIFRVVWAFGGVVEGPIEDVTPTYLTNGVLATLREADSLATEVLTRHSELK